jgi:TnpA family transposase
VQHGLSPQEIAWKRIFHTRPETYKLAQASITDRRAEHPHAALWGDGSSASSDGQFFQASDRAGLRSEINLHYGSEPGSKFYSHLSDQYGYFSILPISATESEAPYVLDGLFDHETELDIQEHFSDTGGASDHVFGLFALTGRGLLRGCAISRTGSSTPSRSRMLILRCRGISACRSTPA